MKIWISAFFLLFMISFSPSTWANQDLEGTWKNEQNQITLIIQSTNNGIRVRRSGQNRWYEYERIRQNQFRDREGNTYYFNRDNTLEWEDRSGNKRIRFTRWSESLMRQQGHGDQFSRNRNRHGKHTYVERNHHYGRSYHTVVGTHGLQGRWINRTTGQVIHVKAKNNRLQVKAQRGGWETFNRRDGNTFVDRRGNHYDVIGNKLIYTSRNRDFRMEFDKQ